MIYFATCDPPEHNRHPSIRQTSKPGYFKAIRKFNRFDILGYFTPEVYCINVNSGKGWTIIGSVISNEVHWYWGRSTLNQNFLRRMANIQKIMGLHD